MRMVQKILAPSMKHGEKADFGAEMFGSGSYGAQRLRRGGEENAVDHILILVSDAGNLFRDCKNDMEVLAVEKLGLTLFNPLCAGEGLALGPVPIAATVVGNALVSAVVVIAFFDVAA